jgi:hypothetical protein
MGLREQAALDAQSILQDSAMGFGWPLTLTSPLGASTQLTGYTTDVSQTIDPDTGQSVSGRRASVAVSLRSLAEMPRGEADHQRKPWTVTYADSQGVTGKWKVVEVLPDRAVSVVVLLLESYHDGT